MTDIRKSDSQLDRPDSESAIGKPRYSYRGPYRKQFTPEQRFWKFVSVPEDPTACWEWLGSKAHGYGQFCPGGLPYKKNYRAHRFAYELLVGPIPTGLHLDHLCRNPGCVNPAHLEPVTKAENENRSPARHSLLCPKGHPLTPENTYLHRQKNGIRRRCRICMIQDKREYRARGRAA